MKRILCVPIIAVIMLMFFGCERVIVTPQDELTSTSWETVTESGIRGKLDFSADSASFSVITATGDELAFISGALAVDKERFFITDKNLCKTYVFSYEVFTDRAVISHMGSTLTFERVTHTTQP